MNYMIQTISEQRVVMAEKVNTIRLDLTPLEFETLMRSFATSSHSMRMDKDRLGRSFSNVSAEFIDYDCTDFYSEMKSVWEEVKQING